MRIDATSPDCKRGWTVYHAEECRVLQDVVWVDDATAEWCQYEKPYRLIGDTIARHIHKARRILILAERQTVIINPIADDPVATRDVDVAQPESATA